MATAHLVLLDETGKTISEDNLSVGGVVADDILRAARSAVQRLGHTIRSTSVTGRETVLVYAYAKGRAPKDLGPPSGWVWRPPSSS